MLFRTHALSESIKWISAGACIAGAFTSASLLFESTSFGDLLLALVLSAWLVLMGLADFQFDHSDALIDKYLAEAGREPRKRGFYIILISLALPCYNNWTQLTVSQVTFFIITKITWIISLAGGIIVLILGVLGRTSL